MPFPGGGAWGDVAFSLVLPLAVMLFRGRAGRMPRWSGALLLSSYLGYLIVLGLGVWSGQAGQAAIIP
ncbi:MAG: hypothetical protein D6761_05560 [Candidatus Dadabacteria bacterium]|nr:MAG: hypothetical protein D6761_05560 [Candidatus Dadabacteria bacterium]